tara:strand:- start:6187 stop:6441 length:255 start_codon:yes stop_codon:yes gene_type:complete
MSYSLDTNKPGLFCSLCEILTATGEDFESKSKFGVCFECELKFVQPRKKDWESGWRPSPDSVKKQKKDIEKRVVSILREIDNYI